MVEEESKDNVPTPQDIFEARTRTSEIVFDAVVVSLLLMVAIFLDHNHLVVIFIAAGQVGVAIMQHHASKATKYLGYGKRKNTTIK